VVSPAGNLEFQFDQILREFGENGKRSKKVDRAIDRALRKTTRWVLNQLKRKIAKTLNINQKAIAKRFTARVVKKAGYGYVWIGLNPVEAQLAGAARQNKGGVTVKGRFFEGAFLQRIYTEDEKVWRRKYRGPGSSSNGLGGGRFPVEKMEIEIEDEARKIIEQFRPNASAEFAKKLRQELNFEFNVKQ
jgi:hypothetical protein